MDNLEKRLESLREACRELRPFKKQDYSGPVYRRLECNHGPKSFVDTTESNEIGKISSKVPDAMRLDHRPDPL